MEGWIASLQDITHPWLYHCYSSSADAQADVFSLFHAVAMDNPDVSLVQLLIEKGELLGNGAML